VSTIPLYLNRLTEGSALKVPLRELSGSKEKICSALDRASRKPGRKVVTGSDANLTEPPI
jgi:hypothetical protein